MRLLPTQVFFYLFKWALLLRESNKIFGMVLLTITDLRMQYYNKLCKIMINKCEQTQRPKCLWRFIKSLSILELQYSKI